ncbi:MAG: DUF2520 domain-containing protein [Firmicutes bacterium]|nr:DUF2520 domain-containing protein [Bacillota bacterium]
MSQTLAIVGAGRVGCVLGRRLRELGWRIGPVVTRSAATARAAVRAIGAGTPYDRLTRRLLAADVVLLATPDSAIAAVAERLAQIGGSEWRGKVVLHTSGALSHAVLTPLRRVGAATGAMHPMQTFGRRGMPNLEGVVFGLDGDPAALRLARQMARWLGGVPVRVEPAHKAAYHAAGGFAAQHTLVVLEAGVRILMRAGFTRRQATRALLVLARQTLANLQAHGPRDAWSGPVPRGDWDTVARHMTVLHQLPPEYAAAYRALTRLAVRLLAPQPKRWLAQLERALDARGRMR